MHIVRVEGFLPALADGKLPEALHVCFRELGLLYTDNVCSQYWKGFLLKLILLIFEQ